jgi:PaaX-like protein C-terminal domain.
MLVADWLALLRADPRLPREFMDADWPATRSYETYRRVHEKLADESAAEFAALIAARAATARRSAPEAQLSAPSPKRSAAARRRR